MPDLNPLQQRSLLFGCIDIQQRLADLEPLLAADHRPGALSRIVQDLSPTERRVVQSYFDRIRARLEEFLRDHDIPVPMEKTGSRWILRTGIIGLHVAVLELGPQRLIGYGSLSDAGRREVVRWQQELTRLLDQVDRFLRQESARDLSARIAQLDAEGGDGQLLQVLEEIITRRGLVEFRPQWEMIAQRLARPRFEIALFGRVSSGKSSLLNHIAQRDVLPVGVTPVTAVPTRLTFGSQPSAEVCFAEMAPRRIGLEELELYASEAGNPGNQRHVTRIEVRLPSPRLIEGVVFVDTPGLGSLAAGGGAETLAYLPQCDLAVVLIDAASVVTADDLDVLRLLLTAGIPAQVLLSKSDLLSQADRQRQVSYIRDQIERELGVSLPVFAVSTVGDAERLLVEWFDGSIRPLMSQHRQLTRDSLRRKTAHLRESVRGALQTLALRAPAVDPNKAHALRQLMHQMDDEIEATRQRIAAWRDETPALVDGLVREAARVLVSAAGDLTDWGADPMPAALRAILSRRARMATELVEGLEQRLRRALTSLAAAVPVIGTEEAAFRIANLPVADLAPLNGAPLRRKPWWTRWLRAQAARNIERRLREADGVPLRELAERYDRQLQAWLLQTFHTLTEQYAAAAGVVGERLRSSDDANGVPGDEAARDIAGDLRLLGCDPETAAGDTAPRPANAGELPSRTQL